MRATVTIPGSKSATNRALVLAALAEGPGSIRGGLQARDSDLMIAALRDLGVSVDVQGEVWLVSPAPLRGPAAVDCGLAGTVMRFLPPAAALASGAVAFDGDPRARQRPMAPLISALRELGAQIDGGSASLPFTIRGSGRLRGGAVSLDASSSSQFISGLLLSGARYDEGLAITHRGPAVPSLPHITMTEQMLGDVGVRVISDTADPTLARWQVEPGPVAARDHHIEPDLSNALPFLAAALVTGGEVTVRGWPTRSSQPGAVLPELLRSLGGTCTLGAAGLTVRGNGTVRPVAADLGDVGELTPVIAALCAVADGPSALTGIAHLRGHETDRLAALHAELSAMGTGVEILEDGLRITPAPLRPVVFHTYDDHRLATAAAVLGLVVPGVLVENVATTAKTLPGFAELWSRFVVGQG